MLESVCLICAMLLEVPSMAANPLNPKKRIISKSFHRILDTQNRQVSWSTSLMASAGPASSAMLSRPVCKYHVFGCEGGPHLRLAAMPAAHSASARPDIKLSVFKAIFSENCMDNEKHIF
eukprot:393968-Pelagomonas_calceolata.AAC.4